MCSAVSKIPHTGNGSGSGSPIFVSNTFGPGSIKCLLLACSIAILNHSAVGQCGATRSIFALSPSAFLTTLSNILQGGFAYSSPHFSYPQCSVNASCTYGDPGPHQYGSRFCCGLAKHSTHGHSFWLKRLTMMLKKGVVNLYSSDFGWCRCGGSSPLLDLGYTTLRCDCGCSTCSSRSSSMEPCALWNSSLTKSSYAGGGGVLSLALLKGCRGASCSTCCGDRTGSAGCSACCVALLHRLLAELWVVRQS